MKEKVIAALADQNLKGAQRFNHLLELYRKHRYANPMLSRNYNRSGFSKNNLKTLEYDVKKVYEIKEKELKSNLNLNLNSKKDPSTALKVIKTAQKKDPATSAGQDDNEVKTRELQEGIEQINLREADYYKEILPLAKEWAEHKGEELKSRKKSDLIAYLEKAKETLFKEKLQQEEIPDQARDDNGKQKKS